MDFLGIYCYYLCMKRDILYDLFSWSTSPHKKPLVLKGARQVGKTWALLEFGKRYYEEKGYLCHYIDFRSAKELFSIFEETSNPAEIVKLQIPLNNLFQRTRQHLPEQKYAMYKCMCHNYNPVELE